MASKQRKKTMRLKKGENLDSLDFMEDQQSIAQSGEMSKGGRKRKLRKDGQDSVNYCL